MRRPVARSAGGVGNGEARRAEGGEKGGLFLGWGNHYKSLKEIL